MPSAEAVPDNEANADQLPNPNRGTRQLTESVELSMATPRHCRHTVDHIQNDERPAQPKHCESFPSIKISPAYSRLLTFRLSGSKVSQYRDAAAERNLNAYR
jgi:hypothetical protein